MIIFSLYVATEEGLSQHSSFSIYLDHCRDKVKGVTTVLFSSYLAMLQHITLCRDINALSALSFAWALLRHIAAGYDIVIRYTGNFFATDKNYVTTETAAISIVFSSFMLELSLFSINTYKTQCW